MRTKQRGIADILVFAVVWTVVLFHWFHLGYITAEDNAPPAQTQSTAPR